MTSTGRPATVVVVLADVLPPKSVDSRPIHRRLRKGKPTPLTDVVAGFLRRGESKPRRGRRKSKTAAVFTAYEAMGPPFTVRAEPTFYRGGVLTIVVEDSAWLTELSFLREEIIERLNVALEGEEEKVESIRLRQGKLTRPRTRPAPQRAPEPILTEPQAGRLEPAISDVGDDDLRDLIRKAARWSFK